MRRFGLILLGLLAGVGGLILLILGGGYFYLRSSLPPLEGERIAEGIRAELTIERDSLGVPAIQGGSVHDVVWGQGFVHGQDRFFQMDLTRRFVAGELAALIGRPALPSDREYRPYGYRRAAERHLAELDPDDRELLDTYVEGVNAGLASLGRHPPEYVVLRSDPRPWEAVDSVLSFLYFYIGLSTHYRYERHLRTFYAMLPDELASFLTPDVSRFDAPVVADSTDPAGGYAPPAIPGPSVVDLRERTSNAEDGLPPRPLPADGSNAWAIRAEDGSTLLANDPHLAITVPGIWYRVDLDWGASRAVGVSPPGLPGVFVGMTRSLAWGVTAAILDQTDLVEIQIDPDDPVRYRVPGGWDQMVVRREQIEVRGEDAETIEIRDTRWGPILFAGHDSVPLALRSPAFDSGGISMRQFGLFEARDLEDLIQVLRSLGGPGLSILMADDQGRIGWIVSGVLPLREGYSGHLPVSFASPGVGWTGVRDESERPIRILDQPGLLHTANQRLLPLPEARELSHLWMSPTRATRIAERIAAEGFEPTIDASHTLQLDTRSVLHEPLRRIALEAIPDSAPDPLLDSLRVHLRDWDGTASASSPHFRVVQHVGRRLMDGVLSELTAPVRDEVQDFDYEWPLSHEPALRILEEQPAHLLPADHADWDRYLQGLLLLAARELETSEPDGLRTLWGEINALQAQHPFSSLSPALARFLNLPSDPQPGWSSTVRGSTPSYGQSLRMVARPGEFDSAIFAMPGGQSGHFMSPYYQRGHRAWIEGNQAPLAAGPPRHTLTLVPPTP